MQNVGAEQFDYGSFKAAYDTDPRVKAMVKNFNKVGVELNTAVDGDDDVPQQDKGAADVSQMAKSATDLGSSL